MSIDITLKRTPNKAQQASDIDDLNEIIDALIHDYDVVKQNVLMNSTCVVYLASELDALEQHLEQRFIKTVKRKGQWTVADAKADIKELRDKIQAIRDESEQKIKPIIETINKLISEE